MAEIQYKIKPSTTILDIKTHLINNNYDLNTVIFIFNNGKKLDSVVFQTDKYDNVNFESYKDIIVGSYLIASQKSVTTDMKIDVFNKLYQGLSNKYYRNYQDFKDGVAQILSK